jgi:benzil reductase ((S)-benzoin forming)
MRLIVLTGFSSGLGLALHDTLLEKCQNDKLIFLGRKLKDKNNNAEYFQIDFFDKRYKWLDGIVLDNDWDEIIFINNAGIIAPIGKLSELDFEEFEKNVYVNYLSPIKLIFYLSRLANKIKILNISSGAADKPVNCWASYNSTKAATKTFFNTIGLENNTSVINIDPGVIDTNMQREIRNKSKQYKNLQYFVELNNNKMLRKPSDVANEIYENYIKI